MLRLLVKLVQSNFVEPKFGARTIACLISKPAKRADKCGASYDTRTPERPVSISLWPKKMMGIVSGPRYAIVCARGWRVVGPLAGFFVPSNGEFVENALKMWKT
jgi:hypothetical protein